MRKNPPAATLGRNGIGRIDDEDSSLAAFRGGTVVAKEVFLGAETEFRSGLTRIKAAEPDLVFMPGFSREVALAAVQAKRLDLAVPFMGGDALEGSYFVSHLDYDDPKLADFKARFEARFGYRDDLNSFLAHDAVLMLVDAMKRAGKADGASIAAALETTDIQGLTGRIRIGKTTHNPENKEAAIIKIEGGRFVFQCSRTAD